MVKTMNMKNIIEFTEEVPFEEIMKYPGEYYAIVNRKIVAHGKDLNEVEKKAAEFSPQPLIGKAPPYEVVAYQISRGGGYDPD